MKKTFTAIALLISLLLVALMGAAGWILGTGNGARFLLEKIAESMETPIEIGRLEGRLLDELSLERIRIHNRLFSVEIASFRLRWTPLLLFTGNLAVEKLELDGVDIRDNRPSQDKPMDLSWPTLSGPATRINGRISHFSLRDFSYGSNSSEPVVISQATGRVDWYGGRAALTGATLRSPAGTLTGSALMGFGKPLLNLFATVNPSEPLGGFSRLLLNVNVAPGKGKEQAAGRIRAVATTAENRTFRLESDMGMGKNFLRVRNLSLTESGRNGRLAGSAEISFAGPSPAIGAQLRAEKLDLSPEVSGLPSLDGMIDLTGTLHKYRGKIQLSTGGTGIRSGTLNGTFAGTEREVSLNIQKGSWLGGTITGKLTGNWSDGLFLSAELRGENFQPALISPEWDGVVNLRVNGEISKPVSASPHGKINAELLSSRFRGRQVTGKLTARFDERDIILDRLLLRGKGFDISAAGNLAGTIDVSLQVDDLGGLVPGAAGRLRLAGKIRRTDGRISGSVTGTAGGLRMESLKIRTASVNGFISDEKDPRLKLQLTARDLEYNRFIAGRTRLDISGTPDRHRIGLELSSKEVSLRTSLEGKYRSGTWTGNIVSLSGKDRGGQWRMEHPAPLAVSLREISLAHFVLNGAAGERLELQGAWSRSPLGITLDTTWKKINLARLERWLPDLKPEGTSSGTLSLAAPPDGFLRISGNMKISGSLTAGGRRTELREGTLRIETIGKRIRARANLDMTTGGVLTARLETDAPRGMELPDHGDFEASLDKVNLDILRDRFPEALSVEGIVTAHTAGKLLPGNRLKLTARAEIGKSVIKYQRKTGEIRVDLRTATLALNWKDQTLDGKMALELAETGHLGGTFSLPLPARLPAAFNPEGVVSANITGKVRENGIMTALFPGMIQESKGELDIDLRAKGPWKDPDLGGTARLSRAGLYLPLAGIRLEDLKLEARLERGTIIVDSFSGRSGPGTINGSATIHLKDWKPVDYRGVLNGNRFQFVYLPELQLQGSPRLQFTGTGKKITVRGEFLIPELTVTGTGTTPPVRPSEDVVIVDAPKGKDRSLPVELDLKVKVVLGDKVLIKAEGIDARLGGSVDVFITDPEKILGKGEIRVIKGSYNAYGVNLDIERGRIIFTGGPVSEPTLDILALRTVDDVSAGVFVVGTIHHPVIRLYSEPSMSDSDIMAYIVLGQPLSGNQSQISAVMQAARLLLSAGQTSVLNDQIMSKFGIDSIGVEQDTSGDVTQSIVTVGKYLTPKLFISYGRSLFSDTTYVKARYSFSKRWEVETWTGTESGVDIYYKINFN